MSPLPVSVAVVGEAQDPLLELGDGREGAAADGLLRDEVEPDLDLVEPGGVGGSEVEMVAGSVGEPALDAGVLVGAVVADNGETGRFGGTGCFAELPAGVSDMPFALNYVYDPWSIGFSALNMSEQNEDCSRQPARTLVGSGEIDRWLEAIRERLQHVEDLPAGSACDGCGRNNAEFLVWVRRGGVCYQDPMCRICVRETLIGFAGFLPPWWQEF